MKIIVGIGNPGEKYVSTRHNVGVAFVMELHRLWNFPEWRKLGTDPVMIAEGVIDGSPVVLAYSETYMNHSGVAGRALLQHFGVAPEQLIVVHDDIDLPIGGWKFSCGRGAGGHNGIRSLIDTLRTNAFCRVRIGVSPTTLFGKMKKPSREKIERFVLGTMSKGEEKKIFKNTEEIERKLKIMSMSIK